MADVITIQTSRGPFTVSRQHADRFKAFLDDPEWGDYQFDPKQSGGYNPRNIRGTNIPSQHSFGSAIDINWTRNARGTPGDIDPTLARTLAKRHGLTWGGDWSNPDPMHFEVARGGPVPIAQRGIASFAGVPKPAAPQQPPDGMDSSTYGAPSPPPSRMALGGPKPMPYDENGQWVSENRIKDLYGSASQPIPSYGGRLGPLAALLAGATQGWDRTGAVEAERQNQRFSDAATQRAMGANDLTGVYQALAAGSPEQKKSALSLMLQEKDPVKRLERELKELEIQQRKADMADDAQWFRPPGQPQTPAVPSPALPSAMPPVAGARPALMPSAVAGTGLTPTPITTGSVAPPPGPSPVPAAPAPKRPQTKAELIEFVHATRTTEEIKSWRQLRRKDPKEALKVLEGWLDPNKEQDKSRMKEAGEGQGKAQAALPGIVSTTDSLLKKIDDVLYEADPKNPGKYLPDPKKPGQFIPNQTLPQVVGSFDGHPWNPTFRSSSVDMEERIKQIGGGAFLQAYESLRGSGSITEKEAAPATSALARIANLRQSEAGYTEALNDFRKEVLRLRQLAFDRASGKLPMPSQEPPSPQAAGGAPGATKPDPAGIR
jgi:hypothetical protein